MTFAVAMQRRRHCVLEPFENDADPWTVVFADGRVLMDGIVRPEHHQTPEQMRQIMCLMAFGSDERDRFEWEVARREANRRAGGRRA